jgi:hypothetical protein
MRKSHCNEQFFSVVGAHNQQVLHVQMRKKTKTTNGAYSSPISMRSVVGCTTDSATTAGRQRVRKLPGRCTDLPIPGSARISCSSRPRSQRCCAAADLAEPARRAGRKVIKLFFLRRHLYSGKRTSLFSLSSSDIVSK